MTNVSDSGEDYRSVSVIRFRVNMVAGYYGILLEVFHLNATQVILYDWRNCDQLRGEDHNKVLISRGHGALSD